MDAGLFAIVAVSLAIGRPFTLQYARERVPQEYWNAPRFLAVNRHITLAWAAALAIMVAADAAAEYVSAIPLWIDIAATVAAFAGAVIFTVRYPAGGAARGGGRRGGADTGVEASGDSGCVIASGVGASWQLRSVHQVS
ncbi:hypothetical protein ACU4GD_13700 [Cupriavidus basilensis]